MIKPEQVPEGVVDAFEDAYWTNEMTVPEAIAAALNAWPGAFPHTFRGPLEGYAFVLPLPAKTINKETENG